MRAYSPRFQEHRAGQNEAHSHSYHVFPSWLRCDVMRTASARYLVIFNVSGARINSGGSRSQEGFDGPARLEIRRPSPQDAPTAVTRRQKCHLVAKATGNLTPISRSKKPGFRCDGGVSHNGSAHENIGCIRATADITESSSIITSRKRSDMCRTRWHTRDHPQTSRADNMTKHPVCLQVRIPQRLAKPRTRLDRDDTRVLQGIRPHRPNLIRLLICQMGPIAHGEGMGKREPEGGRVSMR